MEQSAEVEENHQKSERIPLSKSSGSLIRIDNIYIDLAGAMDKNQDASQCEHFSIRGYVAEMRKKDIGVCLPFSTDDNQIESEEKDVVLPPIDVAKFKWWRCHNCLREIGSACCAQEIGKVANSSPKGLLSKGSFFLKGHLNDAALEEHDAVCTESNRDEMLISSHGHDRDKKEDVGKSIADGSENDAYHQILPVTEDIINSKPASIPERHENGSDAIVRDISGNMDLCEPSFRGHISSNTRPLESNRSNSIDIGQTATSNSPKDQQRMEIEDCEIIPKVGNVCIADINVTKGRTSISSLDEFSSESSNGLAKIDHHDKFVGSSSKSMRQRAPKVRLLAEILGSGGNVENDQSRTTDSDLDSASDFCDDMSVQTNSKLHSKGKRKITQEENGNPLLLLQKSQLSKGNADFAKRNCMAVDSETEESSGTGTFIKQKNLKKHVSSKKKHKQTENKGVNPVLMPRPDVANTFHFATTEKGISRPAHHMYRNTEMDHYYKSTSSPLQAEQKSSMSKKKNKPVGFWPAVPMPQWNTMLGEGSFIRKDSDPYGRKGVDFSHNIYEESLRNKESHIANATTGAEPSLLTLNSTVRGLHHQEKDGILHLGESSTFRKSAPDLDSGKGLSYDLNEKIAIQSPMRDMQNAIPPFGKGTIQHHRELNMPGIFNSAPRTDHQDNRNEDIPMDIVELMAKNQYDRRRHEFERNYFSPERTNEKRKFELMGLTKVHGNGLLKSYQVEDHSVRKPFSQTSTNNSSEHLAPTKAKPIYSLDINETRLNIGKVEGKKSAFVRCSSFSNSQGTQAGRVSCPGYGSIGNGNLQNFQWRSDHIGSSFSPPEARYSLFPNYPNFPQNYAPHASNFGSNSQIPAASSRRKLAKGLGLNFANEKYRKFENQSRDFGVQSHLKFSDPNFVNKKYSNFEKQNKDFGAESLRKSFDLNFVKEKYSNFEKQKRDFGVDSLRISSILDPFASSHRGIDLNAKVSGSSDLHSNEAIPAMQLLSLKDAGVNSNPLSGSDGKRKMALRKPFSSCDYHPKVLDKPMFIYDHDPKEPFGRDIGVSSHSSRPSSSTSYEKNQWIDKSCRLPPIPAFGPFASSSRSESNFREGNGIPIRVPSKFEETKKGPAQNSAYKLLKTVHKTRVSENIFDSNLMQNNQQTSGTVSPLQRVSGSEFCCVNRNPAEFSIPEPGNIYMISGRDLKFRKTISSREKKRKSDIVPTVPKTQ